jgi:sugar lactone lactonase YvrE
MRFTIFIKSILIAFSLLGLFGNTLAQDTTTPSTTETTPTEPAATPEAAPTTATAPKNFTSTIYAGGSAGSLDGNGVRAQFGSPEGFAIANDGTMYVADTQNSTIRKIAPDGTVTTIAGQAGNEGSTDGPLGQNKIAYPKGIDVDDAGNVYFTDSGNDSVYRLSADGQLTTLAGSEASLYDPSGLIVMGNEIYIADKENNVIKVLTPVENKYNLIILAGSQNGDYGDFDGRGTNARFDKPSGISPDGQGNALIADYNAKSVRILTPNGEVTTLIKGLGSLVRDVVVDDKGRYYVAMFAANDIAVFAPDGSFLAQLNDFGIDITAPTDLEFGPDGALYVVSSDANAILKITIED